MRSYGALKPLGIPLPPDTVQTLLLAAGVGQSFDWPDSTGGAAASARSTASNSHMVRFSGMSTGNLPLMFMVNLVSTHAASPSSGSSATTGTTATSTGNNIPVIGSQIFQIPAWSTGWSAAALTSGYVFAEIWRM